jgi:DNA-binding response OmpR family regulator
LIVDDDPSVTEAFARMLTLEGFSALTATSPETGLYEAEAAHVDAILLDLRMPRLNGLAFLRRLRALKDRRETPVAIITADWLLDNSVMRELHALGATTYFKPLWMEDLVRITQQLVGDVRPEALR